ncbi:diadenylate cyclase CdaA [Geobacter sp. SVR]|uniref:diadenylate cyclase CdaA n=1 Tax=Geobacter sp. SVR TaxID=2495594 RepID=UPI00143EF619|nr:diadenylate cyclase CdaA [Geobacter sp. SVR]BCS55138.1 adenylate cyclase [Geobacter sp. SVR]GCF85319.1 adenylate cyclase [Geobacter sp. SVR]
MPSFVRLQDVADILIMTFLLYQLYSWFRRTRAMQVLLGLGVVTLIYFVTRFLGLYMTSWILQELGTVLIVLIIVVFQAEIRQALYRFSLLRHLFESREETPQARFQELAETLFILAGKRTGALVVFQRSESLADLMLNGVRLDCEISPQILEAIFVDGTPLHDGAALISSGRIAVASCHLPLSANPDLPQYLGTRHRAALGLSERTDAIVAVVSEERGEVSLAVGGELRRVASSGELAALLDELINPVREVARNSLPKQMFRNLIPKTAILLIVITFWILITSRQGQITTVTVPVRMHGIPNNLALVRSVPEEIDVQIKSLSSLTPLPSKLDIAADLDLSGVHDGQNVIRIKHSDFSLPSGMVINSINPPSIRIVAESKQRKTVPVKVRLRGALTRPLRGLDVLADPAVVEVEGPSEQIARVDAVLTEELDASQLIKGQVYRKSLLPPLKQVSILRDAPVSIRLAVRQKSIKNK